MTVIDSFKVEFAGMLLQRHRNSSYTPEGLMIKTKDRWGLVSERSVRRAHSGKLCNLVRKYEPESATISACP